MIREGQEYELLEQLHRNTIQAAADAEKEVARLQMELGRYKKALHTANGFLILHNLEPVKLEYSSETVSGEHEQ